MALMLSSLSAAEPTQVTNDGRLKLSPCYSVDGNYLYYSQSSDIGRVFLIKHDLTSGKIVRMFEETTDHLYDAAFSADGKYLAYCQSSGSPQLFLVVKNLEEQTESTYKPIGARSTARRPRFIPGTNQIVFNESGEGGQQISVVNVNGSNRKLVTEISAINRWPDASPDGSRIVFCSSKEGNYDLFSISIDGSNLTQLTSHPLRDIHPTWSPDGRKLAYISNHNGATDIFELEIEPLN